MNASPFDFVSLSALAPPPSQIGVMTVTVVPVRLFSAVFLMLLAWPFAFAASLGRSELVVETETR
ncbi:1-acylglycerophosphocholine O-acyltransferase 1 [Salmo salar]|uniref:1-acylglycerophosphocholine O-acyltransferase 1 n=1 Tax=Salmo salar TaxID=8030 RepID=C0H7C0_SALSA|nr:1-acylglycerophosphocholine O-acyltransferase 1 [Salmo salar]ACN09939.1 1-acylglycerophosphocholine O-acyltransferase 1 [Salmo salar]ACN12286.1 1-acylglycerophosphocholine O-acyltransferase 1 [Salmo salar]|eukprot:NP_001158738.1 1-acylglycerophosphocholine O-acyltransferase 1 [Salmo salar]